MKQIFAELKKFRYYYHPVVCPSIPPPQIAFYNIPVAIYPPIVGAFGIPVLCCNHFKTTEVMEQQLKGGIFITPKEIALITGLSINRARLEHQSTRDALGKTGKRLTVREFCTYNCLDFTEVVAYINPFR